MTKRPLDAQRILPHPSSESSSTGTSQSQVHISVVNPVRPPHNIPHDSSPGLAALSERLHGTVLPKRRRVVRACDRCRKLKIKCSGDIPCIHCTVYSYECTYNQPTRTRKRNGNTGGNGHGNVSSSSSPTISALASSNPQLLAKLSDRLKLYDDILHRLLPDIKLTDLNDNPQPINPMKLMAALNTLREGHQEDSLPGGKLIAQAYASLPEIPVPYIPTVKVPPSVAATATSSAVIAGSIAVQPPGSGASPSSSSSPTSVALTPVQSSRGNSEDSSLGREIRIILPSREVALELISKTWGSACVLFRFYHRPAFIEDLNELYETDPSQYTNKQQRFLPLVYSVLACGALFFKSDERTSGVVTRKEAGPQVEDVEDEGYRYFAAARKLIDITDTRDTFGIQTIVMLIIFLQCSARLSTCYAYIGIALRAALREGLHRKLDYPFNPIELETRKRLFWTLYKMDIYVNTMLGLPRAISEDDFDQELPIELDDENITVTGYRYDKQGTRISSSAIANAHTKLMLIMGHIVAKLYPVKPQKGSCAGAPTADGSATHPTVQRHDIVASLEADLQQWLDMLPLELKPGVEPPKQYLKANRMLHVSYLHVQIILYRPFIHYIAADARSSQADASIDASVSKAQNCISVARVVVKLAKDMIERHLLSGSYWFSIYTIFFSVACLVYYVHFAPSRRPDGTLDSVYLAVKKDAEAGKEVLDRLKDSSTAARRTYNILNALFDQMNQQAADSSHRDFVNPQLQWKMAHSVKKPLSTKPQFAVPPPRASTPSPSSTTSSPTSSSAPRKYPNDQITGLINGVNYIDGVPTGIDLEVPQAATDAGLSTPVFSASIPEVNAPNASASFPPADPNVTSPIDSQYVPGPMDQLDMKIFGRFLPPYMLGQGNRPEVEEMGFSEDNKDLAAFLPYDGRQDSLFEQPNSAIPAGLSTVVQSEQQREQDELKRRQSDASASLDSNFADLFFDDILPERTS
ncbi:DEKNAAC101202 [Brettanomyces naardenensis]|uniref:DEKNAAC101202 n=1 Tax=Brettanomyces naardenensis TaxID=13370 RepID=A0A448YHB8_BRENA|nr:DEKNAAC101202 [Brettanomyces naardenensis]